MECLGGAGYIEESPLPRLYREAPLNSIWEGSGNVIALDVMRTLQRQPRALEGLWSEIGPARGGNPALDRAADALASGLANGTLGEADARWIAERLALVLQAALLVRHAPAFLADPFCASRLGGAWGRTYGTIRNGVDAGTILARVLPPIS